MRLVTIYGASECENVGDDLLALNLQAMLKRYVTGAEVCIVPQGVRDDIERSDVVVIGGGGLIYDYDFANVTNYTDIIFRAAEQQIPVYMAGIGVQHVFSKKAIKIYKEALPLVRAISTRNDADSRFLVDVLDCDPKRIITSRDLAFLSPDALGIAIRARGAKTSERRRSLLLSLADWRLGDKNYETIDTNLSKDLAAYLEYVHTAVAKLAEHYDVTILCQAREDARLAEELVAATGGKARLERFHGVEDSVRLFDLFAAADLAITGRYHGFIAGIMTRAPTIGVSFKGHKQTKLADDTYPSLRSQVYTVRDFVKADILTYIQDPAFVAALRTSTFWERLHCARLTRRNYQIARLINGELFKG